ncbi:phosphodiester glycosidase family protein [Terrabacter terrigena]|uniref:Phosphodiester glycosidase family protein n=1 Tax=Terrabacter terrigena TaxID=574718 RepID=A0ABW3N3G8_9MICO
MSGASTADPASSAKSLPLGPSGLSETRTARTLRPGVTWTHIDRGSVDPAVRWVVELGIPSTRSSPDPDASPRSVQDRASADALVGSLAAHDVDAATQPVTQPRAADVAPGVIGYRVRLVTTFPSKAAADAELARVRAMGFSGRSWYAGWDGGAAAAGHWSVNVLTIDPREFRGGIGGTYGPSIETRERTSWLAAYEKASAAVNAGFFVFDPAAGAEGDPAGAGVYDGRLLSETVGRRPVLVLDPRGAHTAVTRPVWEGTVRLRAGQAALDGIDRVPGLIRNCGGHGDTPTDQPLHDVTCTDSGELVAFNREFGARTPGGAGREVILDSAGRVVRVADARGTVLRDGERSIQATGDRAGELAGVRVGAALPLSLTLRSASGATLTRPGTSVVNGGPQLLQGGAFHVTQAADGMVHPGDPSFQYGWVLQRNPRTFAGVDASGRTVLVTVDGRQLGEMGLSIQETADVAKSLGLVDALNLDGGGSTAMVVEGGLVSHPSDAAGERAVGDAIYVR